MCQRERMSCACRIKVHLCSCAVQLILSTPDFPNAFLNKGSSWEYPEPGGFPGVLLDLAGSLSCTVWAWSGVVWLIDGRGMEPRLAVGKGGTCSSHPSLRHRPWTSRLAGQHRKPKDLIPFPSYILDCYTLSDKFILFALGGFTDNKNSSVTGVTQAQIAHHYRGGLNQMVGGMCMTWLDIEIFSLICLGGLF